MVKATVALTRAARVCDRVAPTAAKKPRAEAAGGMAVPGPDSHLEKVLRSLMIIEARALCEKVVARLKEWHRAPSGDFHVFK